MNLLEAIHSMPKDLLKIKGIKELRWNVLSYTIEKG